MGSTALAHHSAESTVKDLCVCVGVQVLTLGCIKLPCWHVHTDVCICQVNSTPFWSTRWSCSASLRNTEIWTRKFHRFCCDPVELTAADCTWPITDTDLVVFTADDYATVQRSTVPTWHTDSLGSKTCCMNTDLLTYLLTSPHNQQGVLKQANQYRVPSAAGPEPSLSCQMHWIKYGYMIPLIHLTTAHMDNMQTCLTPQLVHIY